MEVFIVNLRKYNEEKETGEWFRVPVDYDEVKKRLDLNENYEEYAIHDYNLPFEINEYIRIEELNRLAGLVEDVMSAGIDERDIKGLCRVLDGGIEELAEKAGNIILYSGVDDMSSVAAMIVEENGGVKELPEEMLKLYFDYEAYARDLEINGCFVSTGSGIYQIPEG